MIFQIAEDFLMIMWDFLSALSLIYYSCIHGYHPTLYTLEPPLSGHLLSSHPPLSGQ